MTPPAAETAILKAKDPSIHDDNDWPEFPLTNVTVFDDSATVVSLLDASESNPITLTGRLDLLPQSQSHLVIHRGTLPTTISVTKVVRYAYGEYHDGEVAFWAAGEAGWFKIRPARAYKEMYQEMLDAVQALYFAADFYRDRKGRKEMKTVAARELFTKYAEDVQYPSATTDEAERIYLRHKNFLIVRMEQGAEGIKWKQTTLLPFLMAAATMEETFSTPRTPETTISDPEVDYTKRVAGKGKSVLRPRSSLHPAKGPGPRESSPTVVNEQARNQARAPVSNARLAQLQAAREKRLQNLQRRRSEAITSATAHAVGDGAAQHIDVELPSHSNDDQNKDDKESIEILGPDVVSEDETILLLEPPRLLSHTFFMPPNKRKVLALDAAPSIPTMASSNNVEVNNEVNHVPGKSESQTQIDLVYKEERPYLPVSNLLKKIKELAAAQSQSQSQIQLTSETEQAVHDLLEW